MIAVEIIDQASSGALLLMRLSRHRKKKHRLFLPSLLLGSSRELCI